MTQGVSVNYAARTTVAIVAIGRVRQHNAPLNGWDVGGRALPPRTRCAVTVHLAHRPGVPLIRSVCRDVRRFAWHQDRKLPC
jgi:hypothetical protein